MCKTRLLQLSLGSALCLLKGQSGGSAMENRLSFFSGEWAQDHDLVTDRQAPSMQSVSLG